MRPEGNAEKLTRDLDENVRKVKKVFEGDETLRIRFVENQRNPGVRCCLVYTDSMTNNRVVNDNIIRPINAFDMKLSTPCLLDVLAEKVVQIDGAEKTGKWDKLLDAIVYGDTVLLAQGCDEALVLNTKGWPARGIGEPESEKVLEGPREGFNEALLPNLAMLRRRLKTSDLRMKFRTFGARTRTRACICHIGGIAKQEIVDEVDRRLDRFDLDAALDSNYLAEYLVESKWSPFPSYGKTERPDVVAAKLLEGRVAIFVDGTPMVLMVPFLFIESFQSNDDYYTHYLLGSFLRVIRVGAFFVTTCIPALYLAVTSVQQELLPTPLLLSISVARQGVPFPTILEILLMWFMFDILRQAGLRMSTGVGQALSIVGALVIGQASVEARIASAPVIIVIAVTAITSLILPRLQFAILWMRLALLLLSFVFGLFGLVMGLMGLLLYLAGMRTFGVPAFYNPDYSLQGRKDRLIRAPWEKMRTRPHSLAEDVVRAGPEGRPEE